MGLETAEVDFLSGVEGLQEPLSKTASTVREFGAQNISVGDVQDLAGVIIGLEKACP